MDAKVAFSTGLVICGKVGLGLGGGEVLSGSVGGMFSGFVRSTKAAVKSIIVW